MNNMKLDDGNTSQAYWAAYPADKWDSMNEAPLEGASMALWIHCMEKYGGPILDVACGNGRWSIPLAAHGAGYEVVGVDINAGFVASANRLVEQINASVRSGRYAVADGTNPRTAPARRRLTERLMREKLELAAAYVVGDIVQLDLKRRFRLAFMASWTWQVLLTQEDQIAFLERLRDHLEPGGAFAFNMPIPYHWLQERLPDRAERDRQYDPHSQVVNYKHPRLAELPLRLTSLAEFQLLFRLTGFEIVEMYGDDDLRPFTGKPGEDYAFVVERK